MIASFFNLAGPDLVIILLICGIPMLVMWPIMRKAGFHPAWALLAFVPFGLPALLLFLAIAPWRVVPINSVRDPDSPLSPPI
ncbi:MAG: hypothetical protein ABJF10_14120 [Chthoniobacter sp.]|uniref:hypothetical protein n=1 Tax=Chthoniobacter sp. TaxID=2510640 RepID=UPI0032A9EDD4